LTFSASGVENLAPDSTDVLLGDRDIAVIVAVAFDGAVDIGVDPTVEETRSPALIEDVLGRPERQSSWEDWGDESAKTPAG